MKSKRWPSCRSANPKGQATLGGRQNPNNNNHRPRGKALNALSEASHGHRYRHCFHFTGEDTGATEGGDGGARMKTGTQSSSPSPRSHLASALSMLDPLPCPHPADPEPLLFPAEVSSPSALKSSVETSVTGLLACLSGIIMSWRAPCRPRAWIPTCRALGTHLTFLPRPHLHPQHILLAPQPLSACIYPSPSQSASLCRPSATHVPDSSTNTQRCHILHQSAAPPLGVTGRECSRRQ